MSMITKPAAQGAVKCPTKRTVNLARRDSNPRSLLTLVCGIVLILALAFCAAKFGVIDQLARLDAAEAEYQAVHQEYVAVQDAVASYPEVEREYRTYSRKWMQDDTQFVSVDRMEVLDLLEKHLMSCGTVESVLVQGELVFVTMSGMNLEEISAMFDDLQQQPIVAGTSLNLASTDRESGDALLDFSITIVLQQAEEGAA